MHNSDKEIAVAAASETISVLPDNDLKEPLLGVSEP